LSGLGSAGAWFRSYLKRDEKANSIALRDRVLALIAEARNGSSANKLDEIQQELDNILRETLNSYDDGAIDEGDLSAFGLVFEQFHHAVRERKTMLDHTAPDSGISGASNSQIRPVAQPKAV
jgi:hypothetical protein